MDWSNMDLMDSLPEEDRARMSAIVDQLQTRDAYAQSLSLSLALSVCDESLCICLQCNLSELICS